MRTAVLPSSLGLTCCPLAGQPVGPVTRFVTLNVCGPAVDRAERLVSYLFGLHANALVLTETRNNEGTNLLLRRLSEAGYSVNWLPPARHERGVAVLERDGLSDWLVAAGVDLPHRLIVGGLRNQVPVTLVAAYVPSRDASEGKICRKKTFLRQMAGVLRTAAGGGMVVFMGDLNIIGHDHVPRYAAFRSWEYDALDEITSMGFVDVYAELNPGAQVHSWVSRRGAGYRYDYAYVSRDLLGSVHACRYVQEPRLAGLTDHAAVVLDLRCDRRCDISGASRPSSLHEPRTAS